MRGNLDPAIRTRLRDTLLGAHLDPAAESALTAYAETSRWDEFAGEALEGLEFARRIFRAHSDLLE